MASTTQLQALPVTKARINLGSVVRQAYMQKKSFVLEKSGIPVAGILGIEDFEDWLEVSDPTLKKDIEKGYKEYKKGRAKPINALLKSLA